MSTPPLEAAPDETVIVEITDLAYRGKGVARHAGLVVFVPHAWPGERVRIALDRRRKRFGEGRVLEVLAPSPQRVAAACPLADQCPGCAYQRLDYPGEVRWKQTQLDALLQRQAGLTPAERGAPLASPRPTGYRNKIVLHAARAGSGQTLLGYVGADNATILDVPDCPLARPDLQALLSALRAKSGFMRSLRPGAALTLRTTAHDGPQHWVDAPPDPAPDLTEISAIGPLRVPRDAFFQVNPEAGALLLETVRTWVRERQPRAVVDLYCGVGVFALAAARDGVPLVRGIDGDSRGIAAARANAAALDLRAEFAAAPAEAGLAPALGDLAPAETLLIVDPPRTGLAPAVVAGIVRHRPAHLLYVSCAADTLARDLRPLAAAGYRLDRIQLVDLFPRTPYFETAALLSATP